MSQPTVIGGGPKSARAVALQVLLECRPGRGFVQKVLNGALTPLALTDADRRLATQLVYGVLRRRDTLDALLRPLCRRPTAKVDPVVWEAVRLGAYQLALLGQIPAHAAIYETVKLIGEWGQPWAKGFVNAMLRALAGLLSAEHVPGPAADALPLEGGRYRKLSQPALPDPGMFPVEYLAAGFALPAWLASRWLERYSWDEAVRLGFWFAGPADLWLRSNPLRMGREECRAALESAGYHAKPGDHPQSLKLEGHAAIRSLPGFEGGWLTVQDASAMTVASALAPSPGSRVLDMCAAPGGKTTHLAELMGNKGSILACDVDDERLATVNSLCARLGISIVETLRLNPENEQPPMGPFDYVLVDVPCSNTGVLGRRPEVRWRLGSQDLRSLVALQTKLLFQALERVNAGGTVVYSTCSIEPEENGHVVRAVLGACPEIVLDAQEDLVPGRPADGGYWARLRKIR